MELMNHGVLRTPCNERIWNITLSNRFDEIHEDNTVITNDNYEENVPTINVPSFMKKTDSNKNRIYVNQNPERNIIKMPLKYVARSINKDRKIAIVSASITKPIDMNELNKLIVNGYAVKRAFGGATASELNYYIHATLNEDKPDTVIINAGTNNLTKKKQTAEEITSEVIEIVKTCKSKGVKNIFVSSITCRPLHTKKINEINEILKYHAGIYAYEFIDNVCIGEEHLRKDGVHLNKQGICTLANNFLLHLNRAIPFYNIWD